MCKTLVVEDNVIFRQMLKESLCSGFPTMEIEEEPDGRELFNKIDSFHPKIVFMDIRLPGENGLELTKKIKENYPDIIIVILTSYDLPEYRQAARESMADYFVPKDMAVAMVAAITGGEDEGVIIERRQQYEEVTFWNNAFGVGNCRSYSNDGTGRYTH